MSCDTAGFAQVYHTLRGFNRHIGIADVKDFLVCAFRYLKPGNFVCCSLLVPRDLELHSGLLVRTPPRLTQDELEHCR